LAKIPLQAMRGAAQYSKGGGIFYCPRTAAITNTLEQMEELWQWADLSLAFVEEEMRKRERKEKLFTAFAFLTFMKRTKCVIFQDAAYMMEFHPERAHHHPLFQLPMFQMDRFKKFREEMRDNVSSMISPIDMAIDHALPRVLHAIKANGLKTDLVLQAQKESIKAIEGGLDRVSRQHFWFKESDG
jgi:hypothetical protein